MKLEKTSSLPIQKFSEHPYISLPNCKNQSSIKTFKPLNNGDIFNLEYNTREVRKVPYSKIYKPEKLFFVGGADRVSTNKESQTNRTILLSDKNEYFQSCLDRVKNIYGRGQVYRLKTDYDENQNKRFKDIQSTLRNEKALDKTFKDVNEKKINSRLREKLLNFNTERNDVQKLDNWEDKMVNPQSVRNIALARRL